MWAVPAAAKVAQIGGRVLNVGTAARAGAEGALAAGIVRPEEGQTRAGNMLEAGLTSAALPLALSGLGNAGKYAWTHVVPTAANAERRAAKALEKTLGSEKLDEITEAVRNAPPSRLPQTTAAAADDLRLGELERGARTRNTARFDEHDTEVAKRVWANLMDDTSGGMNAEQLVERVGKVEKAGKRVLDTYRVDDGAKTVLTTELEAVLNSPAIASNPAKKAAVSKAIAAVGVPNTSAAGLREAYEQLGRHAGDEGIDSVRESLRYVGDSISNNDFSYLDKALAKHQRIADEAVAT